MQLRRYTKFSGSYSYRTPACDLASLGPWSLAEPLQDRLLFAGEASDSGHYGTVTGAMQVLPQPPVYPAQCHLLLFQAGIREGDRAEKLLKL